VSKAADGCVGLAIQSSLSRCRSREDDDHHSRYADINAINIPTCEDLLANLGITNGSSPAAASRRADWTFRRPGLARDLSPFGVCSALQTTTCFAWAGRRRRVRWPFARVCSYGQEGPDVHAHDETREHATAAQVHESLGKVRGCVDDRRRPRGPRRTAPRTGLTPSTNPTSQSVRHGQGHCCGADARAVGRSCPTDVDRGRARGRTLRRRDGNRHAYGSRSRC